MKERQMPERAWVFFHTVTKRYSVLMRLVKKRNERGSDVSINDISISDAETIKKKGTGK
jgi:hypothetical protein